MRRETVLVPYSLMPEQFKEVHVYQVLIDMKYIQRGNILLLW